MKMSTIDLRTAAIVAVVVPLLMLLVWVGLRSGPLAPVAVTIEPVTSRAITPALFGVGTVEARYTYKIGPTVAGRVQRVTVQVGDQVAAGQMLGAMEAIDVDDRILSQEAASRRTDASIREATARKAYAETQLQRYRELHAVRTVSDELLTTKRQELEIASAALDAAREDHLRAQSDLDAIRAQRDNLHLVAPFDGLVTARLADPGTTVVAGQAVVELIDPASLWVNVRFDQISANGLARDLPARIALRSRHGELLTGKVLRVEPKADAVTEEVLAKVRFDGAPDPLPPLGELAEVTVDLPSLAVSPVVASAAVQRQAGRIGVWRVAGDDLQFTAVTLGRGDLDGHVQVLDGLQVGDRVVIHSEKTLGPRSRIHPVDRMPGLSR